MSDEARAREGIARAAERWRRANERAGKPMTQTQAEERVRAAVARNDRKQQDK